MAVYLDPPLWPAHGTHFSHLISDTSLGELHAFAAAAEVPERAFDGDHYDVPERRYDSLVAAGASPVEARVLVRRKLRTAAHLERDVAVRRLTGMLARKGYPAGTCFRVVREELDRLGHDTEDVHERFD